MTDKPKQPLHKAAEAAPDAPKDEKRKLARFRPAAKALNAWDTGAPGYFSLSQQGLQRSLRLLLLPVQLVCLFILAPFFVVGFVENKLRGRTATSKTSTETLVPGERTSDNDHVKILVDMWKKVIDVQQHFNDLELRIRNFAVTLVVGVLGLTGLALKEGLVIMAFDRTLSLGLPLLIGGLIGTVAFWFMDRLWYHRLLYGSVRQGIKIEQKLFALGYPEGSLTEMIGQESGFHLLWANGPLVRSKQKIDVFYGLLLSAPMIVFIALLLLAEPHQSDIPTVAEPVSAPVAVEPGVTQVQTPLPVPATTEHEIEAPAEGQAP